MKKIILSLIAFLIIAAADYGVTKWKFLQDQKMSFKELKDEYNSFLNKYGISEEEVNERILYLENELLNLDSSSSLYNIYLEELNDLKTAWQNKQGKKNIKVTEEDIALVASKWTGIPVNRLLEEESEKLLRLQEQHQYLQRPFRD